jgi:hypothetical protein
VVNFFGVIWSFSLSKVLGWAYEEGMIPADIAKDFERYSGKTGKRGVLTVDEAGAEAAIADMGKAAAAVFTGVLAGAAMARGAGV